jgi:hypothetical protein
METFLKVIGFGVIAVVAIAALSLLMALPVMWLVNYLFTPQILLTVFGVSQITFWQALALNVLTGTLFKSSTSSSK